MLMQPGQFAIIPTCVYHFSLSHLDVTGKDEGVFRRRVFLYYDWPPTVTDSFGNTIACEGPTAEDSIPHDYTL